MECPECGEQTVTTKMVAHSFNYGRGLDATPITLNLPLRVCSACGFEYLDKAGQDAQDEAVRRHLASKPERKESMYERFTDRARKVMQLANQEAQRWNHEYIGTEHILLGLVKEGSGVAANALKNLNIDLHKIRQEVERIVQAGPDVVASGKMPQTPRAKKVIEYAIEEAHNLNHNHVGTEHLLLGLLLVREGVAAQVLMNLGLKLEDVREEVLSLQPPSVQRPANAMKLDLKQVLLVEQLAIEAASEIAAWTYQNFGPIYGSEAELQEKAHEIIRNKFVAALLADEDKPTTKE